MPLTPRTDFKQLFRDYANRNNRLAAAHYASADQLDAYLVNALAEFSLLFPRAGEIGVATVAAGSYYVILPDDWLAKDSWNQSVLRAIEDGRDPLNPTVTYTNKNFKSSSYGYGNNAYAGYGDSLHTGTDSNFAAPIVPDLPAQDVPQVGRRFLDGAVRVTWTITSTYNAERSWDVRYNAMHRLIDETDDVDPQNTILEEDTPVFTALLIACCLEGLIFDGLAQGKDIKTYQAIAREKRQEALLKITTAGFCQ